MVESALHKGNGPARLTSARTRSNRRCIPLNTADSTTRQPGFTSGVFGCHAPVVTDTGTRAIGQIQPGERVLTQCGAIRIHGLASLRPDLPSEQERMRQAQREFAGSPAALATDGFEGAELETAPDFGCTEFEAKA